MKRYDNQIARHIMAAQLASDEAKRNTCNSEYFYSLKDVHIIKALDLISRSKSSCFRFAVQDGKINERCFLVYFSFINPDSGERYQVSFHNFTQSLKRYARSNQRTSWDKKSSRESAYAIANYFNVASDAWCDIM